MAEGTKDQPAQPGADNSKTGLITHITPDTHIYFPYGGELQIMPPCASEEDFRRVLEKRVSGKTALVVNFNTGEPVQAQWGSRVQSPEQKLDALNRIIGGLSRARDVLRGKPDKASNPKNKPPQT